MVGGGGVTASPPEFCRVDARRRLLHDTDCARLQTEAFEGAAINSMKTPGKRTLGIVLAVAAGSLAPLSVITIVVLRLFVFEPFRVPQNGMYPNLAPGSFLISRKHPYSEPSDVRRGDVVVFIREERGRQYNFIWRVIGLPGEHIRVDGDDVMVNGRPLSREQVGVEGQNRILRERLDDSSVLVAYDDAASDEDRKGADVLLGPGEFFVLGDNRFHAFDSTEFGPIPFSSIVAKWLE